MLDVGVQYSKRALKVARHNATESHFKGQEIRSPKKKIKLYPQNPNPEAVC